MLPLGGSWRRGGSGKLGFAFNSVKLLWPSGVGIRWTQAWILAMSCVSMWLLSVCCPICKWGEQHYKAKLPCSVVWMMPAVVLLLLLLQMLLATSMTIHPLVLLLHRGQRPVAYPYKAGCANSYKTFNKGHLPCPSTNTEVLVPFRATVNARSSSGLAWLCDCSWTEGPHVNSALTASKFCEWGVSKNSVSWKLSPGHLCLPARLWKKTIWSQLGLEGEGHLPE